MPMEVLNHMVLRSSGVIMTKVNDWSFWVNGVELQGRRESTRQTGLGGVQEVIIHLVGARLVETLLVGISLRGIL